MSRIRAHIAFALLLTIAPLALAAQARLTAGELQLDLSATGAIAAVRNTRADHNLLATNVAAPLLTLVSGGRRIVPTALTRTMTRDGHRLTLEYPGGISIAIRARERATHLTLEVISATPARLVDAVIWGPYPTTINRTVGEVIGVVRDSTVTFGLQVLNAKTLGGDLPNSEGSTWARGIAATSYPWGSTLQAYALDRSRPRTVDAWGGNQKQMPVPPVPGETVVGSAIALFTCAEPVTLDRLEQIELAEHLPHPVIDGVWFRKSPIYGRSYMISSFGEADVDEMLGYTRRAGLYSLYHEGPFRSWGHFVLNEAQFPGGRAGVKRAVEKAHAMGLHFGVHTLTNFINTNDPYVTPVPDARLSVTGASTLARSIDGAQAELEVASPEFFRVFPENHLRTVRIDRELLQYDSVTSSAPWRLLGLTRGAFGTQRAAHTGGATVGKLFDHSYKVFFPDFVMQREVARNLAAFLNETGVDHIDFDGHEGGLASGQGDYAVGVFAEDVMRGVTHDLIMGTSISKTYYWHIGSYYNWGEPWYGGFRESMQQYRIDNQALFDRNYMPHMLGWYLLTDSTTMDEMEWMLARAAAYSAGFAMVARPAALRANPRTPQLLDAIREWERARTSGAFSAVQRERLKDATAAFHLDTAGRDAWTLTEYAQSPVFVRERVERQPGEPTTSTFQVQQSAAAQRLQFRITVPGARGTAQNLRLQVDRQPELVVAGIVRAGEIVSCDGTARVVVQEASGAVRRTIPLSTAPPMLAPGAHVVTLDADRTGDDPQRIELQLRWLASVQGIQRP